MSASPTLFERLPPVTIQLPLYNERYVLERLIDEIVKIEYPRELLQIQVLDDSTDDTHGFAEALCERYRNIGHPIEYHHRLNREGFKAGALQEGLRSCHWRIRRGIRCRFHPAPGFPCAHHPSFRRPLDRRRPDTLELSQSRLQSPNRESGNDA